MFVNAVSTAKLNFITEGGSFLMVITGQTFLECLYEDMKLADTVLQLPISKQFGFQ